MENLGLRAFTQATLKSDHQSIQNSANKILLNLEKHNGSESIDKVLAHVSAERNTVLSAFKTLAKRKLIVLGDQDQVVLTPSGKDLVGYLKDTNY